jgi:hypothetical protein
MTLLRAMIKIVCNLAKTPSIVPYLVKKGFMDTLVEMLNQERCREIFGNLVMAVAYLSVAPESQERIINAHVIASFIIPLSQCSEIDQKLVSRPKFPLILYRL